MIDQPHPDVAASFGDGGYASRPQALALVAAADASLTMIDSALDANEAAMRQLGGGELRGAGAARLPTPEEVAAAVAAIEPATVMDVLAAFDGLGWAQRGTIRNRLDELVEQGELVCDDERPARYAVNQLVDVDV